MTTTLTRTDHPPVAPLDESGYYALRQRAGLIPPTGTRTVQVVTDWCRSAGLPVPGA